MHATIPALPTPAPAQRQAGAPRAAPAAHEGEGRSFGAALEGASRRDRGAEGAEAAESAQKPRESSEPEASVGEGRERPAPERTEPGAEVEETAAVEPGAGTAAATDEAVAAEGAVAPAAQTATRIDDGALKAQVAGEAGGQRGAEQRAAKAASVRLEGQERADSQAQTERRATAQNAVGTETTGAEEGPRGAQRGVVSDAPAQAEDGAGAPADEPVAVRAEHSAATLKRSAPAESAEAARASAGVERPPETREAGRQAQLVERSAETKAAYTPPAGQTASGGDDGAAGGDDTGAGQRQAQGQPTLQAQGASSSDAARAGGNGAEPLAPQFSPTLRDAAGAAGAQPTPGAEGGERAEQAARAFEAQAARGLAAAVRQRGGVVTMRLQPEALGSIRIEMSLEGGRVAANIEASTAQARDLLSRSIESLRGALEARGMSVDRLAVHLPASQQGGGAQQNAQQEPGEQRGFGHHDASDGRSRGGDERGGGERDARGGWSAWSGRTGAEPPDRVPTESGAGAGEWRWLGVDALA